MFFPTRSVRIVVALCTLLLPAADTARAAKQFRLKFKEGDVYKLTMVNDIKQTIAVLGTELPFPLKFTMNTTWKVEKVGPDDTLEIVQTIDRIRIRMSPPGQPELTIDTAKEGDAAAGGLIASMMGQVFKPMLNTQFRQKMSRRGEVLDITVPNIPLQRANNKATFGKFSPKQAVRDMITQLSPVFPEQAIEKGYSWETKGEMQAPFGKAVVKTTYTYAGEERRDNRTLDKFNVVLHIRPGEGTTETAPKLKEQKGSGTMYFDSEGGYFVETRTTQDMVLSGQTAGQAFTQKLHTESVVTMIPVEKKE